MDVMTNIWGEIDQRSRVFFNGSVVLGRREMRFEVATREIAAADTL